MKKEDMIPEETLKKYPAFNAYLKKKDKYILDENNNVIKADLHTWGEFLENSNGRTSVKQETIGEFFISTVFIGLDHKFSSPEEKLKPDYKPDIFETMVFKRGDFSSEEYCDRYSTWKEAEEGHQKAIEWIKNGCKEENENE
jgi:hypothetical protein